MDGPLTPNDHIECAPAVANVADLDNLASTPSGLLATSGSRVLLIDAGGALSEVAAFGTPISCLAVSPSGALAIGLDGRGVKIVGGKHDGAMLEHHASGPLNCPTSILFLSEDHLAVANGASELAAAEWRRDLLTLGRTGTVARVDLPSAKATNLATNLKFPAGLCLTEDGGRIVVSEAWRHRLLAVDLDGRGTPEALLSDLPAYPGRLCKAALGGYWLTCFAVRSQLQEFVLREHRYRRTMLAEVDPEFWIAPALTSGHSFKEPLQAGGVIRLGIHKPWAPTRSYGLLIRLDDEFRPAWSAHSRANGVRHGVTSVAEHDGSVYASAKGSGDLIRIDHVGVGDPPPPLSAREGRF
jgi:hypothetical protein